MLEISLFMVIFVVLGLAVMILALVLAVRVFRRKAKGEVRENTPKIPSTLTREDFDIILIEEGILSEENRDEVWRGRPIGWNKAGNKATEESLRKSAKAYLKEYPDSAKKDSPANTSA